ILPPQHGERECAGLRTQHFRAGDPTLGRHATCGHVTRSVSMGTAQRVTISFPPRLSSRRFHKNEGTLMSRFSIVPLNVPRCALLIVALVLVLSIAWSLPLLGVVPSGAVSATALTHGAFVDGDNFHQGLVLRVDPLKVSNCPNLYVYLSGRTA